MANHDIGISYELKHHGTKGMRWGRRRYQNKDGTLTDAGRKRYARDAKKQDYSNYDSEKGVYYKKNKKGRRELEADVDKWVTDDMSRTKNLTEASSRFTSDLKRANDNAIKNKPKQQLDLSNMSDKEMREQINRKLLEKQYNDLFAPQNTSRGREYANRILEGTGTALAITGSALGVALAIRDLTGKGK